jgi:hypothetical protein
MDNNLIMAYSLLNTNSNPIMGNKNNIESLDKLFDIMYLSSYENALYACIKSYAINIPIIPISANSELEFRLSAYYDQRQKMGFKNNKILLSYANKSPIVFYLPFYAK